MATTFPILGVMIGRELGQSLASERWVRVLLVIVYIREEDAAQMALVEDHDMVETLPANRTDHAFDVCVLPR